MLEGRLGVIETARVMLPLAYWTKVQNEPEFLLFRAITSETDDLPVGDVRAHWAADALEREDARTFALRLPKNYGVNRRFLLPKS
ncbi:hypothetical protein [Paraburkholderia sp. BCC1884]|uniref:hypothetical protein n=1 Tax=Paraburkholderia sp. BCC1884 TaxID=2562668 RepID=UPI0021B1DCEB|nr:hypothetical protein [Paraburkholderia sp. BCC1884]